MTAAVTIHDAVNSATPLQMVSPLAARAQRKRNAEGGGSITFAHDAVPADISIRNTVRLWDDDAIVAQFTISEITSPEVAAPDEQNVEVKGPGLLSRLGDGIITPWNDITDRPVSSTRLHNFASPGTPDVLFPSTIHEQSRTTLLWGGPRPVAWPDPFATWIWGAPDDTEHPAGTCFFRRWFTLDDDALFVVYLSADDGGRFFIDGVQALDSDIDMDDLSNWWWTWRVPMRLTAGTHLFAAEVKNAAGAGPGGFIASGWTADESGGIEDLVFVTGEPGDEPIGDWMCAAYPATAPGLTAGQMVWQWITAAQARGACLGVTRSFTDAHDSSGNPWPIISEWPAKVRTKIDKALGELSASWVEFDVGRTNGIRLDMWDKTAGRGIASGVVLDGSNTHSIVHTRWG